MLKQRKCKECGKTYMPRIQANQNVRIVHFRITNKNFATIKRKTL